LVRLTSALSEVPFAHEMDVAGGIPSL
jgi:hypothetical protein